MHKSNRYLSFLLILVALFIRYAVSLNHYSGQGTPPMYGDMEAQRHWMEITNHLPVQDWYKNTTENDLMYWGLDYPPLTAYHEKLLGMIANYIHPEMVALHTSRGFETEQSILFMRLSVILSDCFVYIPACFLFVKYCMTSNQLFTLIVLLLNPPLLLIDHAHFQYNSVSLGLVILAVTCIQNDWDCLGSFFFVLAIGYKQIALYYSLVFFIWLLKKCYVRRSFSHLVHIGATVIGTFLLLFAPFLLSPSPIETTLQVIHRMFPWARGLFEDKVASFWCTLNNVIKINKLFSPSQLKLICLLSTLVALSYSLVLLWRNHSLESVCMSLFINSLSFFLFSYHVHEKTILFPLIPLLLLSDKYPNVVRWFVLFASYSMIPLFVKDHNVFMAVALAIGFFVACPSGELSGDGVDSLNETLTGNGSETSTHHGNETLTGNGNETLTGNGSETSTHHGNETLTGNGNNTSTHHENKTSKHNINTLLTLTTLFMILSILYYQVNPPKPYPDLHSVIISSYSCFIFCMYYCIMIYYQFRVSKVKRDSIVC